MFNYCNLEFASISGVSLFIQPHKFCNYLEISHSTMKVLLLTLFVETAISDQVFKVMKSGPTALEG